MARVTVEERSVLDIYTLSGTTYAMYNAIAIYMGVSGSGNTERIFIKLKQSTNTSRKVISIKIKVVPTALMKDNSDNIISVGIYAMRVVQPWDYTLTSETLPMWEGGKRIGTIPDTATLGDAFEFDLTGWVTLDQLLENGIMLYAINDSAVSSSHRDIGVSSLRATTSSDDALHFVVVYADAPDVPSDLSPSQSANVEEKTIGYGRFSWTHNSSTVSGLPQKGYNLQLSSDGVTWTTVSETTSNQYADVAVASIPSGDFYWRVQTIDTDDVPSDYSATQYAYYGTAPAAPTIITSVFSSSKPRLEWSTTYDQAGYRVQILLGSTTVVDAAVESADQYYDVPVELTNSTEYTVRITVKDATAHYSEWAEDAITASYSVPSVPSFVAAKKKHSVIIEITNPSGGDTVIRNDIYRLESGVFTRIGSTTGTTYYDWSPSAGMQTYKVAAVGASGQSVSAEKSIAYTLDKAYLTAVDDTDSPFEVAYNLVDKNAAEFDLTMMEYAGREKPVAEFGEVVHRTVAISFATNDKTEYETLHELLKKRSTMLFRNNRMKLYGVCSNPTEQPEDYYGLTYNLSFLLSEVEHSEVV